MSKMNEWSESFIIHKMLGGSNPVAIQVWADNCPDLSPEVAELVNQFCNFQITRSDLKKELEALGKLPQYQQSIQMELPPEAKEEPSSV